MEASNYGSCHEHEYYILYHYLHTVTVLRRAPNFSVIYTYTYRYHNSKETVPVPVPQVFPCSMVPAFKMFSLTSRRSSLRVSFANNVEPGFEMIIR